MKSKFILFFAIVFNIQSLFGQAVPGSYPYPVPFPASGTSPIGSQVLTGPATRTAYNDSSQAVWDSWLGGGYRSVGTTNERNLIRSSWRKQGMLVNTTDDDKLWKLDANLTNWTEVVTGGGGGSGTVTAVSGTAPISIATGTTTPVVSIAAATTSVPGSMSAADKLKLDGISGSSSVYYHGDAFDYTVSTNNAYRIRTTSALSLNILVPDYTTTNNYPNGTTVFVRFGLDANLTNSTLREIKRSPTLALGDSGPVKPIYTTEGLVPEYGVLRTWRTYQLIYKTLQNPEGWYVTDSSGDPATELDDYTIRFNGRFNPGVITDDWSSTHNVVFPTPSSDFPGRQEGIDCFTGPIATYINGLITRATGWGIALPINHIKLGEGRTVFTTEIQTPVSVAPGAEFEIRCGFADLTYQAVTRGVYFRFRTASPNWQAVTELSSTENASQDTGVVCSASTVYRLRIEVAHNATSASYFINDTLVKVETTQLFSGFSNLVHGQVLIWRPASLGGNSTLRIAQASVYNRPVSR